ncbi:nodal-related 2 [Girardinichthys multiradiatus]|uniref:nodal-related 2 n=1 Tax=Girardinichthys multiradiatus TaxID=208333 RepID=UPI001FAE0000|nr:nodal-related 2 [Girardinichthys multiradiatus]
MRSLEALGVALHASLLVLLAHGIHKFRDGPIKKSHPFPLTERSTGHHLPTYMMHLYRNFKSNFSGPLDNMEQDAAKRADTVKSVMAKSLIHRHGRWVATFDLNVLLADTHIQAAELRIRFNSSQNAPNDSVEVYHLDHEPVGLLDNSSLVTSSHSWKVFNMTSPLLGWLGQKSAAKIRSKRISRPKKAIEKKRGLPFQPVSEMSGQALLVVFSHMESNESSMAKASLLHTAEQSKFLSPAEIKEVPWRRSKRGQREQTTRSSQLFMRGDEMSLCHKVDLYVNFQQIGWGSWIVFPKKYNAYRCEGSCPGPLGEGLNPTNHAYMQSLLKHYHPDRVAPPCCAPTKMSPLSMLYYENNEMLLRHHEDMVVNECGCQ